MGKGIGFTQLSDGERSQIEVLLKQGLSYSAIGRLLGRSTSTISREVARNSTGSRGQKLYVCLGAGQKCRRRHQHKAKRIVFTSSCKDFVARALEQKYSPSLISVNGRKQFGSFVSAEWIYQWIWKMKFSQAKNDSPYQRLFKHLMHARRKRKRGLRRNRRGNILGRVYIEKRPREATVRASAGHLEGDIVLGANRQPGLLVVLDRKSRKTWIRKLPTKDAAFVCSKLQDICLAAKAKTLTLDNDQSFARHYELQRQGVKTFFTHPYSSQEKGSVENRIGLIRMHFPKKTDFTKVTSEQVKKVQNWLNNRPMKMFGYKSPNEMHQKK